MSSTITIRARGIDYDFPTPEYGYTTEIMLAMLHQQLYPGQAYSIWDNGAANDYRLCKGDFLLNASDANGLITIYQSGSVGRGISIELHLHNTSGFFPGGPDKGDSGKWMIRFTKIEPGGVEEEPYKYFRVHTEFVIESYPSYSLPSPVTEGDLQIGSITGLRWPPNWSDPINEIAVNAQLTYTGAATVVDKTTAADQEKCVLPMVLNQSKAAALINHMAGTVRDNNLNIVTKGDCYLFGRIPGAAGTYSCQWIDGAIKIIHNRHDEFAFDLSFFRLS